MSEADDRGGPRDLARDLIGALAPVLRDVAAGNAVQVAREAAQGLGLSGLGRLLAACSPHAGRAWPAELVPAIERLRRLAAGAVETGVLGTFREADRELDGLAEEVAALQWSPVRRGGRDDAHPVATLSLAETLDELPLADDFSRDLARRSRLLPPVAAALRAALDWLTSDSGRPLALRAEDSVLEVSCEHIDFAALTPATEVLAAVGANLGPGAGPTGTWTVRAPLHTGHGVYLMLVHGGVPIAIPWHAVLRLHMAGAAESAERESLGDWSVLKGLIGADPRPVGDVPLVLIGHGRKRAWLVADRLVWRLQADPVAPTERSPADGLVTMVETDEGERYWLADPEWILRSVEAPALARSAPRPAPEPVPEPVRRPAPGPDPSRRGAELHAPLPEAPTPPVPVRPEPHLWLLTPEDVERIDTGNVERIEAEGGEPVAPAPRPSVPERAPAASPAAPAQAVRTPSAPVIAPPGRRPVPNALVAEDSITARIFLARLLTRSGFDVSTVDTAAALRAELERRPWSLVCVDIELPDEAGTAFLAGLASRHAANTPFVALVRDAEDRAAARRAGFERMLRKPFDHQELEQVLGRLGFSLRDPS